MEKRLKLLSVFVLIVFVFSMWKQFGFSAVSFYGSPIQPFSVYDATNTLRTGGTRRMAESWYEERLTWAKEKRPKFPVKHEFSLPNTSKILSMCNRFLYSTLLETTELLDDGTTYVVTGDIKDMWLRDSSAQVHPYIEMASEKSPVRHKARRVISGLIQRQAQYIRHDPWANAFSKQKKSKVSPKQKRLGRLGYIATWNYELDSGCYFLRLLYFYWLYVPNDPVFQFREVKDAVKLMVQLWKLEQYHEEDRVGSGKLFDCEHCHKPYRYPELLRNGKGSKTAYTGMSWSGHRPSDDKCTYNYLVPSNMFAVVVLRYVSELAEKLWMDESLKVAATKLAKEIDYGIRKYGIVVHPKYGKIYAYEVDGLGNSLLMDDANVPSLLSAPYLGYEIDARVYQNTRKFILSKDNPYYQESRDGKIKGYGSPHMQMRIRNNIWPMGQIVQGLTSTKLSEKLAVLKMLVSTDGGTGRMHESYNPNNPSYFTREWFTWPESLFAELVMSVTNQCPERVKFPMPKVQSAL